MAVYDVDTIRGVSFMMRGQNNMQTNSGNNIVITQSQFGDCSRMIIEEVCDNTTHTNIPEEYWEELKAVLISVLRENELSNEQWAITHNALNCVENKNTKGLIAFLKNSKNSFLINILSNFASTGLLSLVKSLCG